MSCYTNMPSLPPGQWFSVHYDRSDGAPQTDGPYLILSRYDFPFWDQFQYIIMDTRGTAYTCSSTNVAIGEVPPVPGCTFSVLNQGELSRQLGNKAAALHECALWHIKQFCASHWFGKCFDPDDPKKIVTGEQIRQRYNLPY